MKRLLLAGAASLGIAASGSVARAVPIDFTYAGSLVTFTVPATGLYQILAFGAQGGNSNLFGSIGAGGRGAEIGGELVLSAGEMLQIAVGGAGSDGSRGGAGGGGSFVVGPDNTPLVIAGGGGGGGNVFGVPLRRARRSHRPQRRRRQSQYPASRRHKRQWWCRRRR